VECKPLLSKTPRLPSVDGSNKMSKSMDNCILLDSSEREISKAVKSMYTDPTHLNIEDPGQVEGNIVFTYLDAFHPDVTYVEGLKAQYRKGGLGDGKTKKILEECLQDIIRPIRERRKLLISDKSQLIEILRLGSEKSQNEANELLNKIKQAFGLRLF